MKTVIQVEGMMCTHCKAAVEKACMKVAGVTEAVADLKAKNVTVTGEISLDAVKKRLLTRALKWLDETNRCGADAFCTAFIYAAGYKKIREI